MSLVNWQFSLDGVAFGEGTPYFVTAFDHAKPEIRVQDQDRPRSDGILFGKDFLSGTTFNIELDVEGADAAEVLDNLEALRAAWQADTVRATAGAASVLSYRMPGRDVRRLFGRPRRFTPATLDNVAAGFVPVVADFQARDHLFYDDAERVTRLDQVTLSNTGFIPPLVPPLTFAPAGEREGFVTNAGKAATPVTITFHGPATSPSLLLVGANEVIKLDTTLIANETVVVDTYARTVLRGGVANVAGRLTRSSRFWQLPAGTSELRYSALDATATSFVEVRWRNAHYSL